MFRLSGLLALSLLVNGVGGQEKMAGATASRGAYNVGGNLGFAFTRAQQQNPEQPLNEAGRQWIIRDLDTAFRWASLLTPCVAFDATRFQQASMMLTNSNPPANQTWRAINQLQVDFAAAIARASCSLNVSSVAELSGLYQAGFAAGVATGRASHFYIDQRLPGDVAGYIRNDLMQIRPRLQAVSNCLGPLDAIDAATGSVLARLTEASGRAVYEEITRLYIAIDERTTAPSCASNTAPRPTPNPMPGNDLGSCMQQRCGQACQGAAILLGEVSGSPQCVACVKQNCGR